MGKTIRFDAKYPNQNNKQPNPTHPRSEEIDKGNRPPTKNKKYYKDHFSEQRSWPIPNENKSKKGPKI